MKLHKIAYALVIVGGLNWGLEGAFNTGLASWLPYDLVRIIYILVGLSAVYEIVNHKNICKECEKGMR